MAGGEDLVRKLAESKEIEIETRRDPASPLHRTTIWIVPAASGVYIRSGSRKGRWYREPLANPNVTVGAGRRKVLVRVQPEGSGEVIRAVNAAYLEKYGRSWPDSAKDVVRRSRLDTTIRLTPA